MVNVRINISAEKTLLREHPLRRRKERPGKRVETKPSSSSCFFLRRMCPRGFISERRRRKSRPTLTNWLVFSQLGRKKGRKRGKIRDGGGGGATQLAFLSKGRESQMLLSRTKVWRNAQKIGFSRAGKFNEESDTQT